MEKTALFDSLCKKFENLFRAFDLDFEFKDTSGLINNIRQYRVFNGPCFSDYFLGSELRALVRFCDKYKGVDYCINTFENKVCFIIYVPFDL